MRRGLSRDSWPRVTPSEKRKLQSSNTKPRSTTVLLVSIGIVVLLFTYLVLRTRRTPSLAKELQSLRISPIVLEPQYQYFLSACVVIRESSDLLPEFLVRNYAAGVDHFFIYGDDDDPEERSRLQKIFSALDGMVDYISEGRSAPDDEEDPQKYVQMRIYRHCLRTFGPTTKWMALIDTDEFFETYSLPFLERDEAYLSRTAFMHHMLLAHEMLPIVCVRWKTALTNGRLLPAKKGETLNDLFPTNCRVQVNNTEKLALRKPILQPRFLDFERTPKLDVAIHKGFRFLGSKKKLHCIWGVGHDMESSVFLLHYWSRDLLSYLRKIQRGRPRKGVPKRNLEDLFNRERVCSPETRRGSSSLRRQFVRDLITRIPHFEPRNESLPTAEQLMETTTAGGDYTFCQQRVSFFISKVSQGMTFSDEKYCNGRVSEACDGLKKAQKRSWPFPWAEFLLSCNDLSRDSDFFV